MSMSREIQIHIGKTTLNVTEICQAGGQQTEVAYMHMFNSDQIQIAPKRGEREYEREKEP